MTVRKDGREERSVAGILNGKRGSSDIGASFEDPVSETRRGQDLEIRVNVPNNATCAAALTFYDSEPKSLGSNDDKDRCLWSTEIPKNAPRGMATITVVVGDGGDSTTLLSNVEVLGKDEASRVTTASTRLPGVTASQTQRTG